MKWRKYIFPATLAIVCFTWAACDNDDDNNNGQMTLNQNDRDFISKVSRANKTEIAFGQLAVTKARDSSVMAFAQQMVTEHTNAQNELKNLADNYSGVTMTDSIDQQHQQLKTQLSGMSGATFDSAYIASQVTDHQNALSVFNTEISSGSHAQVKAYATKYKPHIQEHLDMADSLQTMLANDSTTNQNDTTTTTGRH